MQFFSAALLFGFIVFVTCADPNDPYAQKPSKQTSHRTMKPSKNNQEASSQLAKPFNAEEVGNILRNAVPGKDYPIYSMDDMPKTSFRCDGPNIHYPGYYADVEAGCQLFHYCPPKLEENYQKPQDEYKPKQQDEYKPKQQDEYKPKQQDESPKQQERQLGQLYRRKRGGYGETKQTPAQYYTHEEPVLPQITTMKPKYEIPEKQESRDIFKPQTTEQEEQLISWLCPNQTIFNQQTLVCEWFYDVVCEHAVQNYDLANSRLYHEDAWLLDDVPAVEHPSNLPTQPASQNQQKQQGGNEHPGNQMSKPPSHKISMPRKPSSQQANYNSDQH